MSKSEKTVGAAAAPADATNLARTALINLIGPMGRAMGAARMKQSLGAILDLEPAQVPKVYDMTREQALRCAAVIGPLADHYDQERIAALESGPVPTSQPQMRTSLVADGLRLQAMCVALADKGEIAKAFEQAADCVSANPDSLESMRAAIDAGMAAAGLGKVTRGSCLGAPHKDFPDDLKDWETRLAYQRGVADARRIADDYPAGRVMRQEAEAAIAGGLQAAWSAFDKQAALNPQMAAYISPVQLGKTAAGGTPDVIMIDGDPINRKSFEASLTAMGRPGTLVPLDSADFFKGVHLNADSPDGPLETFRRRVADAARGPLLERIKELEAELAAVGAGGVQPLSVVGKDMIKELAEQVERLCSGLEHYDRTELWSDADVEEIEAARRLVRLVTPPGENWSVKKRDPRDVASDPEGKLIVNAGEPLKAAACPECQGTGSADSGGMEPWGWPIGIPCNHGYPWPVVRGTGRVADNEKALTVYCERSPTDEELANLHDALVNGKVLLSAGAAEAFANDIAVITTLLRHAQWHPQDLQTEQGKALGDLAVTFFNAVNKVREDTKSKAAPTLEADVDAILGMLQEREWAEHATKTIQGCELADAITELHNEISAGREDTERLDFIEQRTKDWTTHGISFLYTPGIGCGYSYMHRHHQGAHRDNLREVIDFERGIMPTLPEFKKD